MASRVIQTEEIQSGTGVILASELNKFAISPDIVIGDLTGNQLTTKDMLVGATTGLVNPDLEFMIPIGTSSPFVFDMTTYSDYGLKPWVNTFIEQPAGDGTILQLFFDMQPELTYTDYTKTSLVSISINGHLDDYGNFAENTFVVIKANSPSTNVVPEGIEFYKVLNATTFDLKYWNNMWTDNPDGDPAIEAARLPSALLIMPPGDIVYSYLADTSNHTEGTITKAYFSGADDRMVDVYFNGTLQSAGVSIHDLVPFITQSGPIVGGNYWVIKES